MPNKSAIFPVIIVILVIIFLSFKPWVTVLPGQVVVATLFGKVQQKAYPEGLHFPVNPLNKWVEFDVRQKTHKELANVPSQDQLQTSVEVSVQYRLNTEYTPRILQETGTQSDVLRVQLVPKLRSLMRETGKTVKRAEDFFLEETQERLQTILLDGLKSYLEPKGVDVSAVLIRDIQLPPFIKKAIESKKEREQEVEKQKAELERFTTEQQQVVALAQAKRQAAEEDAKRRRVLADVHAYEIEQVNNAIGNNPNYIKLEALKALQSMSKDPSSKIYFIDGNSQNPIPLMHFGEK